MSEEAEVVMGDGESAERMLGGMADLSTLSIEVLRKFLSSDDPNLSKAQRDKARIALSAVNSAISMQRAYWTQQRAGVSIAKTLADGDLDSLQRYVSQAMPGFPTMRQLPIPEARTVSAQDEREQQTQPQPSHPSN